MGEIRVGITSWTEPTLVKSGRFYPPSARSAEERLQYYASQFPIVEVDSTYYAMPSERTAGLWTARTPDKFIFDVKAFRLFTQHQTPPEAIPRDIRNALPPDLALKKNVYYRDLPAEMLNELWQRYASALVPLDSTGKLGVVLFQFPPWFFPGQKEREHIAHCQEMLPYYRLAVEFRRTAWVDEKHRAETMSFLREHNLTYVCCDEPQGFPSSVPFITEATSDIGVVRLHGRNRETWEKKGISVAERFNCLYNGAELSEIAPMVKDLSSRVRQLHVLFNNCYEDKAVVNARQMRLMLD